MIGLLRGCGLVAAAALVAGCATRPAAPLAANEQVVTGRLAVRIAANGPSAERAATMSFDLRGAPTAGRLDLSTPLGSTLAQARWSPGQVVLSTPQGDQRFADLDSLSRETLGEVVPVAALFDWLRGRPWPGAAHQGLDTGFEQLGWRVDLSRLRDGQVLATREQAPKVTVRALVDPS